MYHLLEPTACWANVTGLHELASRSLFQFFSFPDPCFLLFFASNDWLYNFLARPYLFVSPCSSTFPEALMKYKRAFPYNVISKLCLFNPHTHTHTHTMTHIKKLFRCTRSPSICIDQRASCELSNKWNVRPNAHTHTHIYGMTKLFQLSNKEKTEPTFVRVLFTVNTFNIDTHSTLSWTKEL